MEWKRTVRTVWIVVICSGAPLMAAQASPGCEAWNTEDYFKPPTVDGVRGCLEAGADPMARNGWSVTPLHQAAEFNENPAVIQALLAAGADPEALDAWNSTPLRWARLRNNVAVIDFLLSNGQPSILSAQDCRMWHTDVFFRTATVHHMQACLAAGADPNAGG